jgi:hypothetical protein
MIIHKDILEIAIKKLKQILIQQITTGHLEVKVQLGSHQPICVSYPKRDSLTLYLN